MGRPAQGWKLYRKPGRRVYNVKFTFAGRAYELSTKHEDEALAKRKAAELYAAVVSGTHGGGRTKGSSSRPLSTVTSAWVDSLVVELDVETIDSYVRYCDVHFEPFFKTVEAITNAKVGDYVRDRLKKVLAVTVKKELGALLKLAEFAGVNVMRPTIGKKTVGTRHAKGKRYRVALSPDEVTALLAALPERKTRWARSAGASKQRTEGQPDAGWPVRARYVVAYETTLRPETLDCLSVPEHYTKGATHLSIADEIDKARFGRELPLTATARAALDAIAPEKGLIFGRFTNRKLLRKAAAAAGIDAVRASRITVYDIRRARLTHLADAGKLTAAQWLAGHKRISTTAIYAQGSLRAAEEAVR
jgi:site-specific recombinase XerD